MLSTSMIKEEVDIILESLLNTKLEEARQRLTQMVPQVSSEYGKGAILAINGILNVMENRTPDKMADSEKILRAADRLPKTEMIDDLDKGYLQTLGRWARRTKDSGK